MPTDDEIRLTQEAIDAYRHELLLQRQETRRQAREDRERRDRQWRVWSKTGGRCWYCGVQCALVTAVRECQFHVEHQLPKAHGGTDDLSNLVPACAPCNSRKGTLTLEAFRAKEARRALPLFTPEHIAYLQALHVVLPPDFPCYPTIVFWGGTSRGLSVLTPGPALLAFHAKEGIAATGAEMSGQRRVAYGKFWDGQQVLLADEGEITPHEIGVAKDAILLDGLRR